MKPYLKKINSYKKYILIPTSHQKKGIIRKGIQNIGYLFQGLQIKQTSPVQESFYKLPGFVPEPSFHQSSESAHE